MHMLYCHHNFKWTPTAKKYLRQTNRDKHDQVRISHPSFGAGNKISKCIKIEISTGSEIAAEDARQLTACGRSLWWAGQQTKLQPAADGDASQSPPSSSTSCYTCTQCRLTITAVSTLYLFIYSLIYYFTGTGTKPASRKHIKQHAKLKKNALQTLKQNVAPLLQKRWLFKAVLMMEFPLACKVRQNEAR